MRILTFGASNSRNSINADLAKHVGELAAELVRETDGVEVEFDHLDLNDFEMPLYGIDREQADGIPPLAQAFLDRIAAADAMVISFAEHNGTFTVAFKNILDWASRHTKTIYQDTPLLVLSASPGPGGARSVLEAATKAAPFFGGDLRGSLSVPSFHDAWDADAGRITDPELAARLRELATALVAENADEVPAAA